jgi:hypothetical protein
LARAPDDLMEALRKGIHDGLEAGPELERQKSKWLKEIQLGLLSDQIWRNE